MGMMWNPHSHCGCMKIMSMYGHGDECMVMMRMYGDDEEVWR